MGAMMGGMTAGMMGGGGGSGMKSLADESPLQQGPPPEAIPRVACCFKCNVEMTISMFPMPMPCTFYYDFPRQRQRTEWEGGWEVERWDIHHKVKMENGQPTVERLDKGDHMTTYDVPPFAKFAGYQTIRGVPCQHYISNFFGMLDLKLWVSVPRSKEEAPVPVYADATMMGIRTLMHFTNHNLDFEMRPELFAIEQYIPPPPPPPSMCVQGYVIDATNKKSITGAMVTFGGPQQYRATTDSNGKFSIQLPIFTFPVVTYEAPGYLPMIRPLIVMGNIFPGTFADAALCPILPQGQQRFVLRWNEHPRDLDLWCFDAKTGSAVCGYNCKSGNGAVLNVDVQNGFGPETITINDTSREFLIRVVQYSSDGHLAGCGAVVDCYDHTGRVRSIEVPQTVGNANGRTWNVLRTQMLNITPVNEVC